MSLHQFNPGRKSWKIYGNTLTSISGDDLTINPYYDKDLILEASGNGSIIFKQGDTSYNLADLSNVASGGGGASDINGLDDGLVVNNSSYFIGGGGSSVTTNAINNTFFGYNSGNPLTSGDSNVGIGSSSLFSNTTGSNNIGIGFEALYTNTIGQFNIAIGSQTLYNNNIGDYNTAVGVNALYTNTTGFSNTALGSGAGLDNTTGSNNIYIGVNTSASASNNNDEIVIGANITGSGQDTVTIGANDNIAHYLGKALIGNVGHSNYAGFSYRGLDSSSYALLQDHNGGTRINAKFGEIIYFFINDNSNNGFTFDGTTLDMNNKIISNVREIKLGSSSDSGTDGSVLISKGSGNPVEWSGSNFNINTSTSTFNCVNLTASQNVNCSSDIRYNTLSTTSLRTRTKEYNFNLTYTNSFATVATISRNFNSNNWRSAMVEICIAYSTSNGGGSGGGSYVGNFRYIFQSDGSRTVYTFPVNTIYNNGGYLAIQFVALNTSGQAGGVQVQLRNYRGITQVVTMSMKVTSLDHFNLT
jgi:hypothetical protein